MTWKHQQRGRKTFKKKSFEPEKYINEKFTKEIEKVDLNKKKEKKVGQWKLSLSNRKTKDRRRVHRVRCGLNVRLFLNSW